MDVESKGTGGPMPGSLDNKRGCIGTLPLEVNHNGDAKENLTSLDWR